MRRGDYGYDAPYVPLIFGFLSIAARPRRGDILAGGGDSHCRPRRGKFLEWERILDDLHLRGDEGVLDMGCGRGAVLTAVARRLSTGRVTGVDIWSRKDQSGNARDVTLRNASLEGVGDRVQIETGDMRALPYPDATFDLVVSSLVIHNIRSNADRKRAVVEGFRVLKPGGRIVIADIRATGWGGDSGGATRSNGTTLLTASKASA